MEKFLLKIEKMFEKQNIFIQKQFNKLSKRVTNIKSRVVALENKKCREKKPTVVVKPFDSFTDQDALCKTALKIELSNIPWNQPRLLVSVGKEQRKIPKMFRDFIDKQFENDEQCNLYQKGDRTYVFQDGWRQLDSPKIELKRCLDNLWDAFCQISTEVLKDKDGYTNVFSKIITTNKTLTCPMSTCQFKTILRKVSRKV